jgi:hypothetical protein
MSDFIKTKLLFEYKPGQLIGLGFGNIVNSDADLLIISAFETSTFVSQSSIGSLNKFLKETTKSNLEKLVNEELKNGCQLIDLSSKNLRFKKILVISMGEEKHFNSQNREIVTDQIMNSIKKGLAKARILLSKESSSFTIDITALGTTYGGLRRKECFDMLINWATDLFTSTSKVSLLRFIAYDLDTFVDFFESAFRLQKIKPENELSFSANYDSLLSSQFKGEINSALRSLDDNPRGVIITCRSIIESIVKSRISDSSVTLVEGIFLLKQSTPPSIYSYLTTCRLLGNFSNHDPNFIPTRRDAEGILLLTLRIVEWHLSNELKEPLPK